MTFEANSCIVVSMIERGPVTIDQTRERYVDPRKKPIHFFLVEHDPRYPEQLSALRTLTTQMMENTDPAKKIAIIGENRSGIPSRSDEITRRFEAGVSLAAIYADLEGKPLSPFYTLLNKELTDIQAVYPQRLTFVQESQGRALQRQGTKARRLSADRTAFLRTYRKFYKAEVTHERAREANLAVITRNVAAREDVGGVIEVVGAMHTGIGHELKRDGYTVSRSFPNRLEGPWHFEADDAMIRRQLAHPDWEMTRTDLRDARRRRNEERRLEKENPTMTHQQILREVFVNRR